MILPPYTYLWVLGSLPQTCKQLRVQVELGLKRLASAVQLRRWPTQPIAPVYTLPSLRACGGKSNATPCRLDIQRCIHHARAGMDSHSCPPSCQDNIVLESLAWRGFWGDAVLLLFCLRETFRNWPASKTDKHVVAYRNRRTKVSVWPTHLFDRRGLCSSVRMTAKTELAAPKRRTRAEVQRLVAEFVSSGMRRSEFCQSRGLSFSTLDRHLKKRRWKRRRKPISSAGRLVPVELAAKKSPTQQEPSCRLAVVLSGGRRIEVHPDFDTDTFERVVSVLERV